MSSSPVPSWRFAGVSLYCEVFSMPLTLRHLCCALTLHQGEIKMLSLGISLHWSFLSLFLFGEAAQGALLRLCAWGVVTRHSTKWDCARPVALGGTRGVVLNRGTGTVTGLVTNCAFIPRYCVYLLPWCHSICSMVSTISVLLALNCKSKQSKSHLQT